MAVHPGTVVNHYEIVAPLGAGGMGEVYLARDRRLHREVALKLLPVDLISDSDRTRRFEQEAQAASALNHASRTDGVQAGECGPDLEGLRRCRPAIRPSHGGHRLRGRRPQQARDLELDIGSCDQGVVWPCR